MMDCLFLMDEEPLQVSRCSAAPNTNPVLELEFAAGEVPQSLLLLYQ